MQPLGEDSLTFHDVVLSQTSLNACEEIYVWSTEGELPAVSQKIEVNMPGLYEITIVLVLPQEEPKLTPAVRVLVNDSTLC